VRLRASVPGGSVFLLEGTHDEPANLLTEPLVEIRRVAGAGTEEPSAIPVILQPAAEGLTEPPASAPQSIPPVGPPGSTTAGGDA
jgi:hypothetical protein